MINPSIALYGVAKSATPAPAAPKYSHGLVGGEPFSAEATVETDSVSCGVRAGIDSYKTEVNVASDIETRAYAHGVFEVRTAWDGPVLGSIPVRFTNLWTDYSADIAIPDGVNAIYLTYRGPGSAQLASFTLE